MSMRVLAGFYGDFMKIGVFIRGNGKCWAHTTRALIILTFLHDSLAQLRNQKCTKSLDAQNICGVTFRMPGSKPAERAF
jgi:hypothetical protein